MEGKTIKILTILVVFVLFFYFSFPSELPLPPEPPINYPSILKIDSLRINAPIIFTASRTEAKMQEALQKGVIHLSDTAMPGEIGNVYIAGHSSDYWHTQGEYKRVFERLPEIKVGDLIQIKHNAELIEYLVFETKIVDPYDTWVLSQETQGRKLLSLQTSYPVGSADQRFIVVAEQLEK